MAEYVHVVYIRLPILVCCAAVLESSTVGLVHVGVDKSHSPCVKFRYLVEISIVLSKVLPVLERNYVHVHRMYMSSP